LGTQERRQYRIYQQIQSASTCVFRNIQVHRQRYRSRKYLKGWLRERKVALIRSANPTWEDLSEKWFDEKKVIKAKLEVSARGKAGPSLRSG
jgi:hypothetical protein